tara:strand:+ start:22031 stop:23359 length:1329 start_codon:yes stop_codon:yes gene_type:complete
LYKGYLKTSILVFSYILLLGYISILNAKTEIHDARVWDSPDSIRVVFDISGTPNYKVFTLKNPNRVVIDLHEAKWSADKKPSLTHSNIKKLRYGLRNKNDLRIVLDLNDAVKPKTFVLAPNQTYGHRLVVDLPFKSRKADVVSQLDTTSGGFRNRDYLVAIDPGHGGEDPGAIGKKYKTREKDIVFSVAKILEQKVNQTPGMRAFLVRKGDYYIKLRDRISYARRQGADLFVSVHADSFKDPKATGASVYILSEKGESSEAARWLAESENRADLIGGVSLDGKGDILAQVLLDLSQSASKAASYDLGNEVLASLAKVTNLHKKKVQQAGFVVLKSPDIPSILVELGFISNPQGERNLSKPFHKEKLAQAMLEGIKGYVSSKGHPIHQYLPAPSFVQTHKVRSGDSLEQLALQYKTTVEAIKSENKLKSDIIRIGQVLQLPSK